MVSRTLSNTLWRPRLPRSSVAVSTWYIKSIGGRRRVWLATGQPSSKLVRSEGGLPFNPCAERQRGFRHAPRLSVSNNFAPPTHVVACLSRQTPPCRPLSRLDENTAPLKATETAPSVTAYADAAERRQSALQSELCRTAAALHVIRHTRSLWRLQAVIAAIADQTLSKEAKSC